MITTLQKRQRFHPTFNPYGLVVPESKLDRTTTTLATMLMERIQRGGSGGGTTYTDAVPTPRPQSETTPKQKNTRSKYKKLKRNHKALEQKYNDLQKETMRRQIAHDIHIEILVKERCVRESLFTHAISELERKLSAFTNSHLR
jgi:hypothetical protein